MLQQSHDILGDILTNLTTLTIFTAVWVVVSLFTERINPVHRGLSSYTRENLREVGFYYVAVIFVKPLTDILLAFLITKYLRNNIIYDIGFDQISNWPLWLQIITGLFCADLCMYWRHRFMHVYGWDYHAIHHDAKQIRWTTTYRMHPFDTGLALLVDYVLLYLLGYSDMVIISILYLIHVIGVVSHFNIDFGWKGWLRYVLVSPNFHRWHHAKKIEAVNKNYSVVFPFIDILFGTFYFPSALPKEYGIFHSDVPQTFWGKLIYPFTKINKNKNN